jgi:hypothetical protein
LDDLDEEANMPLEELLAKWVCRQIVYKHPVMQASCGCQLILHGRSCKDRQTSACRLVCGRGSVGWLLQSGTGLDVGVIGRRYI